MKNQPSTKWREQIETVASHIVYRVGDELSYIIPDIVKARQATNDKNIDYAKDLIEQLLLSQRTEIIDQINKKESI